MADDDTHSDPDPPELDDELHVLSISSARMLATWKNTLVTVWHLQMSHADVAEVGRRLDQLARVAPGGTGWLSIIEPTSPPPALAVRSQLAQLFRESRSLRLSALVYEGTGFREMAVRALVTSINVLIRLPFEHEIFSSVADACEWFVPRLPGCAGMDPYALHDAVDALRRERPR